MASTLDVLEESVGERRQHPADRWRETLLEILPSFSRLDDPRALRAEPQWIRLYRVARATNAKQALRDSGVVSDQRNELALMNHLLLEDRVTLGTRPRSVTRPVLPIATQ